MASDWWAKKLDGIRQGGPASFARSATPPTSFSPAQPTREAPAATWGPPGAEQDVRVDPNGQMSIGDAVMIWNGGQGTKVETTRCPGCGSGNFFSRNFTESGMPLRGPAPAPECFDCGYPTVQFGSGGGAGAAASTAGSGQAYQLPAPPAPSYR